MHLFHSMHQQMLSILAGISVAGNLLLITLILHRQSTILGHYRWLLLAFAVGDITISLYHAIVVPTYFQIEYGCLAFVWAALAQPPPIGFMLNAVYTILFYEPFILLMFHFVYRLIMLISPSSVTHRPWRFALLAVITNLIMSAMLVVSCLILALNADDFFGPELLQAYGIDTKARPAPELILMNFIHSKSRGGGINWITIGGIGNSGVVVSVAFSVIAYCTVRIGRVFKTSQSLSPKTRTMHVQLFRALLVQFIVPFLFSVIPYLGIIIIPLVGHRLGEIGNILANLVSIFPAIDAFVVMFLVGRFRLILKNWLIACRCRVPYSTLV